MATVALLADNTEAFLIEAARRLMNAERALVAPLTNVSMVFADVTVTVSGTLPITVGTSLTTGAPLIELIDYTPDADPDLTGSSFSTLAASSLSEALMAAVVAYDAGLQAKIDTNATVPAGVASSFSFSDTGATFSCSIPYTVTFDTNGNQVITAQHYIA